MTADLVRRLVEWERESQAGSPMSAEEQRELACQVAALRVLWAVRQAKREKEPG